MIAVLILIILYVVIFYFTTIKQDKKDLENDTRFNSRWVNAFYKNKKNKK